MKLKRFLLVSLVIAPFLYAITNKIEIGSTLPLSKEGKEVSAGMDLAFNHANERGGVHGKKISFRPVEDDKSLTKSVNIIESMMPSTRIFSNVFVNGVSLRLKHQIKNKDFLMFAPEESSEYLRSQDYPGVIHLKPSIHGELEVLIDYAINELSKHTFAIFYERGLVGNDGFEFVKSYLEGKSKENKNIKFLGFAHHPKSEVNIEKAVDAMVKLSPEVIICISRRNATYNFVSRCLNKGLLRTVYLGTSYLAPIQKLLEEELGVKFFVTTTLPDLKRDLPIINEFKKLTSQYTPNIKPTELTFRGYFNASVLLDLISKVSGPITHKKIIEQAEKIQNYNFKGVVLNFDSNRRSLFNYIEVRPSDKESK